MLPRFIAAALMVLTFACPAALAEAPSADTPQQLAKIAGWKGAAPSSPETFTFVVMSDRNGGNIAGEWPKAVAQVNLLRPDFVMCVGDLIGGYTEDVEKLNQQWDEFEAENALLDAPFFYTVGNHDITNPVMRELYLARHGTNGKTWYSFNYRGCHFVVLDSMAFADEAQLAWLEADMAAAGDAAHVFVFYHHPQWDNAVTWPRLAAAFPTDKTTIFNGHWHNAGYHTDGGIPTYVLPATAADTGEGQVRMFAQVRVDAGKPAVALVPMNTVMPLGYIEFMAKLDNLLAPASSLIGPEGGSYTFDATNPLDESITIRLNWEANGWQISPEAGEIALDPGAKGERTFQVTAGEEAPTGRPALLALAEVHNPYLDTTREVKRTTKLGAKEAITAAIRTIVVDGDVKDWAGVQPLVLQQRDRIFKSPYNWSGPADSSCRFYVAADDKMLYAVAVVRDDDVWGDPKAPAWFADGVEFMWDVRPESARIDARTAGTGQVILTIPTDESNQPTPNWFMNELPEPKGLQAAFAPIEGGYVIELALPLAEIGLSASPKPGDVIHIGLLLNDRDHGGPEGWNVSRFAASGIGNESGHTFGYARCTFK